MLTVTDPRKEGLPAINKSSTRRDSQHFFLAAGIEALTHDLRQGRAVNADAIKAAEFLVKRAKALSDALDARYAQQVTLTDEDGEGSPEI